MADALKLIEMETFLMYQQRHPDIRMAKPPVKDNAELLLLATSTYATSDTLAKQVEVTDVVVYLVVLTNIYIGCVS